MSYFLTKIFQHPICLTVSKAALKSMVYKPSRSPLHSFTSVCVSPSKWGEKNECFSNEHTSTQHFYSYSISLYSDQIFLRHHNTLFWPGIKKKISQRVALGQRFFGCENQFNFFSSFEIGNVAPICIQFKNSLLHLPKWVGEVVFAEPQSSPKCLVIH